MFSFILRMDIITEGCVNDIGKSFLSTFFYTSREGRKYFQVLSSLLLTKNCKLWGCGFLKDLVWISGPQSMVWGLQESLWSLQEVHTVKTILIIALKCYLPFSFSFSYKFCNRWCRSRCESTCLLWSQTLKGFAKM